MSENDDDYPLFEPFDLEDPNYGPSWGCIIGMGIIAVTLLLVILLAT